MLYDDIELLIEPTINKDFIWDRKFEVMWDITRALKFNYSAITSARSTNPRDSRIFLKPDKRIVEIGGLEQHHRRWPKHDLYPEIRYQLYCPYQ